MTDTPIGRALAEHRTAVLVLAALLVANLLAYGLVVSPLSGRVASVESRNRAAAQALALAQQERTRAADALAASGRAAERLATFYDEVLPADLVAARRLADPRLWQQGERTGLQVGRATYDPIAPVDGALSGLQIGLDLVGTYPEVRSFIRRIEQAPEFLVIDAIRLQEAGDDEEGVLQLGLNLSTYYRGGGGGAR